ncbi:DHA2 family efflux MFS transporter permease subunit [Streptomyces sp. 2A115]|uniref:DHA2 family efflux MFS transporter permease subunit n=1 Tax=Streptomyces sp. 2A115 TaxID=3457439 RepID=UPI003FD3C1BC
MASEATRRQSNPWIAMTILCAGLFVTVLDTTIVNVAIPSIMADLGAGLDQIMWVISAYVLAVAVLIVTAGRLGDIVGARTMFLIGLSVFTVGSLLCALATSPMQLILFRAVQGVGAALLTPQPMTLMMAMFPPEKRGVAGTVWGISAGVAAAVGPTLGGLLVTWEGWPWIFYINVPVGVVAFVLTLRYVPDLRLAERPSLNLSGVVLTSLGLLGITFGLLEGERYGWGTVTGFVSIPLVIAAGVALLVVFVFTQARVGKNALVPLSLFRMRNFSLASAAGLAISLGLTAMWVTLSIYMQSVLGLSPLQTGLALAPAALVMFPVFGIGGPIIDRTGGKWFLVSGLVIFALAAGYVVLMARDESSLWLMMPGVLMAGVGQGLVFAPLVSIAMFEVPESDRGAASGAFNAIRQTGFVIGAAVVGALLEGRLASAQGDGVSVRDAFADAMVPTLSVVVVVFAVVALASLKVTRPVRKDVVEAEGDVEAGGDADADVGVVTA